MLQLASEGRTDKEIAAELGIGTETVSTYWRRIRSKYRATSRTQAVAQVLKNESNAQMREMSQQYDRLTQEMAERYQVEDNLRQSAHELKKVLDSHPDDVACVDIEGRLISSNLKKKGGSDMHSIFDLTHDQVLPELRMAVRKAIEQRESSEMFSEYADEKGKRQRYWTRVVPVTGHDEPHALVTSTGIDKLESRFKGS